MAIRGTHDPSTVIQAEGKFYVYSTSSGWTWRRGGSAVLKRAQ
jgi:hypothetical protein